MKIIAFSDTHFLHESVHIPDGDVLIHAGDFCGHGTLQEVEHFNEFLGTLPHQHKILIAGNHDWPFEREPNNAKTAITNAVYLQDEQIIIDGIKFYGSPWQPEFFNWAFNLPRGKALLEKWSQVPDDTDVLITHGPPFGIMDMTMQGLQVGCKNLLKEITHRIRPKVHIFGHIHEEYGLVKKETLFVNASSCDEYYKIGRRDALVIEIKT